MKSSFHAVWRWPIQGQIFLARKVNLGLLSRLSIFRLFRPFADSG